MQSGLKILTLNCWGLPFITPQKNRRLDAIAKMVKHGPWDIVALQEIWLKKDQERIIKEAGFPYSHVFGPNSITVKSGLVLLSRHKILKSDFHKFQVSGFPHRVQEGEFFASKGVGFALLETPIGELPLFVAHLIACHVPRFHTDANRVFRMAQMLEMVFYIRRMASPKSFVLCGDLNSTEEDLEMETLRALIGARHRLEPGMRTNKRRLDHIISGATLDNFSFQVKGTQLVFRHHIEGVKLNYSDHEGVSAIIQKASGQALSTIHTHDILERKWRYMKFCLEQVRVIDKRISLIPVIGWFCSYLMKPQLTYIQLLIEMLETDLKQAESKHPLRLASGA
jgi:endonuclease/exonuclease/phosphatase family metal-dependent hydrolase